MTETYSDVLYRYMPNYSGEVVEAKIIAWYHKIGLHLFLQSEHIPLDPTAWSDTDIGKVVSKLKSPEADHRVSYQNGNFFQILNTVLDNPKYKAPGKTTFASRLAVYAALVRRMNVKTRQCWPGRRNLSKLSGVGENTVDKALQDLENLELISIEKRYIKNARISHMYTVLKI